eukprot:TRINITY_DN6060_c0_g1_i2.p1 TRINITY_DN6060_c0_g1~~TRINITY_DN6060_c0_g1_i2.p1  ORF type:complete len:119 (-),score=16.16 TRINITY_DN6060_c0_g1_i2:343-699(-)
MKLQSNYSHPNYELYSDLSDFSVGNHSNHHNHGSECPTGSIMVAEADVQDTLKALYERDLLSLQREVELELAHPAWSTNLLDIYAIGKISVLSFVSLLSLGCILCRRSRRQKRPSDIV